MKQLDRIEKLKKSEDEILSSIYWTVLYLAIALFVLSIIFFSLTYNVYKPTMIIIILSIVAATIYTLVLIYLIGLAVAFGTIRAKGLLLKAEIDVKEGEEQEEKEGKE